VPARYSRQQKTRKGRGTFFVSRPRANEDDEDNEVSDFFNDDDDEEDEDERGRSRENKPRRQQIPIDRADRMRQRRRFLLKQAAADDKKRRNNKKLTFDGGFSVPDDLRRHEANLIAAFDSDNDLIRDKINLVNSKFKNKGKDRDAIDDGFSSFFSFDNLHGSPSSLEVKNEKQINGNDKMVSVSSSNVKFANVAAESGGDGGSRLYFDSGDGEDDEDGVWDREFGDEARAGGTEGAGKGEFRLPSGIFRTEDRLPDWPPRKTKKHKKQEVNGGGGKGGRRR
jgi:hypothetical protein